MSAVDAMGPGTPTPVTLIPRAKGSGVPLTYSSRSGKVQADVAKGNPGQNVQALFEPRPPVRPPGVKGGPSSVGSFVDVQA